LHSDTIFSICKFSLGSAIRFVSVRQTRREINHEGEAPGVWLVAGDVPKPMAAKKFIGLTCDGRHDFY
jgi:hypothetical protein